MCLAALPPKEARAENSEAHESQVRGIGVGINLTPGDTEASLRTVRTFGAFIRGGFEANARV